MKARIALTRPDDIDATVTITMSLGHWKRLREQIDEGVQFNSPGDRLRGVIRELVEKAEAHFEAEKDALER